jgi:hypothetical protein
MGIGKNSGWGNTLVNKIQELWEELKSVFAGRGVKLLDALLPVVVFLAANSRLGIPLALGLSIGTSILFFLFRIIKRDSLSYAFGGVGAALLAGVFAFISDSAVGFFLPGLISSSQTPLGGDNQPSHPQLASSLVLASSCQARIQRGDSLLGGGIRCSFGFGILAVSTGGSSIPGIDTHCPGVAIYDLAVDYQLPLRIVAPGQTGRAKCGRIPNWRRRALGRTKTGILSLHFNNSNDRARDFLGIPLDDLP